MITKQELLCSFCQRVTQEPLTTGEYVICEECGERGIPCSQCGSLTEWGRALYEDFRLLKRDVERGHCDVCKGIYYQAHREDLQQAYHHWITSQFPTPSFTYGLLDPRDRLIHYVGRTHNLGARMREHRGKGSRDNSERSLWIRSLHNEGLQFDHCILSQADPGYTVVEMEARWISVGIQRGWPLTNQEVSRSSPDTLAQIRSLAVDYLTCPIHMLRVGDRMRIAQITMYAAWAQSMPRHLPDCDPFFGLHPGDDPALAWERE